MAAVGFGEREAEALPRATMKSAAYPAARRLLAAYAVRGLASFPPSVLSSGPKRPLRYFSAPWKRLLGRVCEVGCSNLGLVRCLLTRCSKKIKDVCLLIRPLIPCSVLDLFGVSLGTFK